MHQGSLVCNAVHWRRLLHCIEAGEVKERASPAHKSGSPTHLLFDIFLVRYFWILMTAGEPDIVQPTSQEGSSTHTVPSPFAFPREFQLLSCQIKSDMDLDIV